MQLSTSMPNPGSLGNLKLPDLFESFRSLPPRTNPLYAQVKEASLKWLSEYCKQALQSLQRKRLLTTPRICGFDEAAQDRLRRADFAYITAVAFPDVEDFDRLLVITNWFNWVFFFDDQLDDTAGHEDKEPARRYIDSFVTVLNDEDDKGPDSDREEQPSRFVFRCIWQAVKQDPRCPPAETKLRWADSMNRYFEALRQALVFEPSSTLAETVEGYIEYRFHTVGVLPIFAFIEYFYALRLPSEVWTHPEMIGLREAGVKMAMIDNDVVSYHREKDLGCPHNIIHLHHLHGMSEQDAYDLAQHRQRELYRTWYTHRSALPLYGEHQDGEIQRYLRGLEQVVTANLNWSFRTQRYFGENVAQVRQTGVLPRDTQWLDGVIPDRGLQLVTSKAVQAKALATSTASATSTTPALTIASATRTGERSSMDKARAVLVGA
ncbi:hypothetical protein H2200_001113 [Cladophialophora chaetospira]|uniref:Terpene synthase n=1 Tax=Cladophialophora chaetospira TaxID=386627 RepID=A0AA39CNR6_9EURO|nr:hypothetical protein H2200_001113 [Cladophialophora chaetospira]